MNKNKIIVVLMINKYWKKKENIEILEKPFCRETENLEAWLENWRIHKNLLKASRPPPPPPTLFRLNNKSHPSFPGVEYAVT